MFRRAIEQRWKFNPKLKGGLLGRISQIIADPNSSERLLIACAKILVAMEKQNQDDEHKFVDISVQRQHYKLDAIAEELGLDPGLIESVSREAGSDIGGD